jgi:hypothetical protein
VTFSLIVAPATAIWREHFRAVPVQFRMKPKLRSIVLFVAVAGVIAGGCGYVACLASRTRLLEARLARVEAALNGKQTTGAWTVTQPTGPAKHGAAPLIRIPQVLPPGGRQDSLEQRVEKIEQELTPHVELLSAARPEAPGVNR